MRRDPSVPRRKTVDQRLIDGSRMLETSDHRLIADLNKTSQPDQPMIGPRVRDKPCDHPMIVARCVLEKLDQAKIGLRSVDILAIIG